MPILCISGDILDPSFQLAKNVAEDLLSLDSALELEVKGLVETEWRRYANQLRRQLGGKAFAHALDAMVTHSTLGYIGTMDDLIVWAGDRYGYRDPGAAVRAAVLPTMRALGDEQLAQLVATSPNQFAYIDFQLGDGKEVGSSPRDNRVVFELFRRKCGKTTANFLALCNGDHKNAAGKVLKYQGTPVHRIVRDGWIQAGDIVSGKGTGGESIFGPTFPDECLSVKHDRMGVLSMANTGPHSNASQFFITLTALPSFDTKKVAFGRAICGLKTLERINAAETRNERPRVPIVIANCGTFDPVVAGGPGRDLVHAWTNSADRKSAELLRKALGVDTKAAAVVDEAKHSGTPTRSATVLVLGLDGAGKSTTINHFIGQPRDAVMPTVGFEPSETIIEEYKLLVYGLGGSAKFRGIWPQYFGAAHAIVFVIDASDEDREDEVKTAFAEVVQHPQVKGKPIAVFANKQDLASAASAAHIQLKLGIDSGLIHSPVKIFRSVALVDDERGLSPDPNIPKALSWLLHQVTAQYVAVQARVAADETSRKEADRLARDAKKKAQAAAEAHK